MVNKLTVPQIVNMKKEEDVNRLKKNVKPNMKTGQNSVN